MIKEQFFRRLKSVCNGTIDLNTGYFNFLQCAAIAEPICDAISLHGPYLRQYSVRFQNRAVLLSTLRECIGRLEDDSHSKWLCAFYEGLIVRYYLCYCQLSMMLYKSVSNLLPTRSGNCFSSADSAACMLRLYSRTYSISRINRLTLCHCF